MNRKIGIWNNTLAKWVIDADSDNSPPRNQFETANREIAIEALIRVRELELTFRSVRKDRRFMTFELRYRDDNSPVLVGETVKHLSHD